jgi:hypothetical protein
MLLDKWQTHDSDNRRFSRQMTVRHTTVFNDSATRCLTNNRHMIATIDVLLDNADEWFWPMSIVKIDTVKSLVSSFLYFITCPSLHGCLCMISIPTVTICFFTIHNPHFRLLVSCRFCFMNYHVQISDFQLFQRANFSTATVCICCKLAEV